MSGGGIYGPIGKSVADIAPTHPQSSLPATLANRVGRDSDSSTSGDNRIRPRVCAWATQPSELGPESLIYWPRGRRTRSGFTASDGIRSARDLLTLDNAVENLGRRFKPAALFDARTLRAEDLAPRQVLGNEELDVHELQRLDN